MLQRDETHDRCVLTNAPITIELPSNGPDWAELGKGQRKGHKLHINNAHYVYEPYVIN